LRVRESRPDLRLVVQLANPSVGAALELVSGAGSVLDVATLASPAFVEACTQKPSHDIEFGGVHFAVAQLTLPADAPAGGTFRTRFGDLAPVAVLPAGGGEPACCPGRDHPVGPGDLVAVLGTVGELAGSGISVDLPPDPSRASMSPLKALRRVLRTVLASGARGLTFAVIAVISLLTAATVLIHFAYVRPDHGELSLLTSAYFAVETVVTVGFGDFSYAGQAAWLKVFAIVFILSGVTMVTTTFALFTNFLVSRRIERVLGSLRVPDMSGHVIVVGLGSVGIRVVEGLQSRGRRVVVVERDAGNRYLGRVRALGVPVVIADATQRQTHAAVNLKEASAVAVMTSDDLTNIETGLAVRDSLGERWDDVPVVLRVFDRNLARLMERSFGFGEVRSTAALAAPFFVGAALGLDILGTFFVAHQPFLIARLTVAEEGGLQGLAMKDLSARTRVIAIRRAGGALEH
ncbi:MAG: potassium channel family protein, partial [Acidimicrobiales bacterium]